MQFHEKPHDESSVSLGNTGRVIFLPKGDVTNHNFSLGKARVIT